MSTFTLDYLVIKFAELPQPVMLPWLEVFSGQYLPEESTPEEAVVLMKKTADNGEQQASKTHIKKADIIAHLDAKLREPANPQVVDYGSVEDVRFQPAGRDLTEEVSTFLAKYKPK
jgi:hypothetical protein